MQSRVFIEIVMWFSDEIILLCCCWNHRSINYWRRCSYFDSWYFAKRNKTIEIVIFALFFNNLNVKILFCMNVSTRCANFFNCFDVFDLSLLLWQSKAWNDWRLSLKTWTKSKSWNHVCKFVVLKWFVLFAVLFWNFQLFQARICFLCWTIRDNMIIHSIWIAIFNCKLQNFRSRFDVRFNFRKAYFSLTTKFLVQIEFWEQSYTFSRCKCLLQLYTNDVNLMIIVIIRM